MTVHLQQAAGVETDAPSGPHHYPEQTYFYTPLDSTQQQGAENWGNY